MGRQFISASHFINNNNLSSYNYTRNNTTRYPTRQRNKPNRYKPYTKIPRFQIWNENINKWSDNIQQPPILLTPKHLQTWRIFKTQQLVQGRLYLWQAEMNKWIPMWALPNGFLLKNMRYIAYDQVTWKQFEDPRWINNNFITSNNIKQLLYKFNINYENFASITIKMLQNKGSNKITVVGVPHFTSESFVYEEENELPIFNRKLRAWGECLHYNKTQQRWN